MAIRAEEQITLTKVNDGQNGFSPTATVTKSGETATITITDINGTTSEEVSDGANGISISSVKPQYYLSTSSTSATGGSWSDTPPTFEDGKYYWTRDYITYSNGTSNTSTAVYNRGMTQACYDAQRAVEMAEETTQYTWHTETDTGAGAGTHITQIPQDDFLADATNGGFNMLIDSLAMKIRNGLSVLANYGSKLILGSPLDSHIEVTDSEMTFYTADNNVVFDITAGNAQTISTFENVGIEIANNATRTYEINLVGAGRGKELDCYLEDAESSQYTDSFTIELGVASSGSGTGNLLYSYSYDGDTTLTITNTNNGSAILFEYINYFKTSYTAETLINGELLMINKSNEVGVSLTGSGNISAKEYFLGTQNITSPTLSSSGLTPVSSRCTVSSGGILKLGKWRYVQLQLTIKTSLSANNTWGLLDTFDIPATNIGALAASVNKNYGNVSCQINSSGRLVVQTGGAALAANDIVVITGLYIAS